MIVEDASTDLACLSPVAHRLILRDGTHQDAAAPYLQEHSIEVYLNGCKTMALTCVPQFLTELILGRLLTENIIQGTEDVQWLRIPRDGKRADITLRNSNGLPEDRILPHAFAEAASLKPVKPIFWKPEWIFQLADRFANGMPLHTVTWATHSCFLARNGEILFSCEDIGRHHAMDKVIGYALRNDIPLPGCIVYSSGRIPQDMALKAIRAGVPVLVSKAAPTQEAISLANAYGLTLICSARRDSMRQYSGW